jgi:probable HAF family extracellular repeat protein
MMLRTWLFTLVVGILPATASAQSLVYTIDDLGVLPGDNSAIAWGINESGDVVGWSNGVAGTRAFLFTDSAGMVELDQFPGVTSPTLARDINDAGVVVGQAKIDVAGATHAVRWVGGVPEDLGAIEAPMFSEAWAISAFGDATGDSNVDNGAFTPVHAFLYTDFDGSVVDITPLDPTSHGRDINASSQIAGYCACVPFGAFRWTPGTGLEALGIIDGFSQSFAFTINDSGQTAGHVVTASANSRHIFRTTDGPDGLPVMIDLGGVGERNDAWGINNLGDVVGQGRPSPGLERAMLYTDENGLQDLNELLDPALVPDWFLLAATDINEFREISGYAMNNVVGQIHAVRLRPVNTLQPPAAPSALTATVVNATWINLGWSDNSDNENGFNIERRVSGGSFAFLGNGAQNGTTFIDATVQGGTTYDYRIQAVNQAGTSTYSNIATATTPIDDTEAPAVGFVTPNDGATVSGRVAIEIAATDNVGVALVRLLVDGTLKCESQSSPLTCTWNTKKVATGAHTLLAWASDAAGNVAQQVISVTLGSGGGGGNGGGGNGGGGSNGGGGKGKPKK